MHVRRLHAALVAAIIASPLTSGVLSADTCADRTGGAFVTMRIGEQENFTAWVTDAAFVKEARDQLAKKTGQKVPNFKLVDGTDCADPRWSFHVDPKNLSWSDMSIEGTDGLPSHIEAAKKTWLGGQGEGAARWTPWSTTVLSVAEKHSDTPRAREKVITGTVQVTGDTVSLRVAEGSKVSLFRIVNEPFVTILRAAKGKTVTVRAYESSPKKLTVVTLRAKNAHTKVLSLRDTYANKAFRKIAPGATLEIHGVTFDVMGRPSYNVTTPGDRRHAMLPYAYVALAPAPASLGILTRLAGDRE